MLAPQSCPICQSPYLRQVLRDASFSATLGGELSPLLGVRSYKCDWGHVFMIVDAEPIDARSDAEGLLAFETGVLRDDHVDDEEAKELCTL